MNLALAEALVSGEQAVLMDLTVYTQAQTPPVETDVIAVFDTAHEAAHRVFVNTTKKLSNIMELIGGGDA